jgi:hypothetical protein
VQPVQLSLLPEQVPAPPSDLAGQLPEPLTLTAVQILARLIAAAARTAPGPGAPPQETVNSSE